MVCWPLPRGKARGDIFSADGITPHAPPYSPSFRHPPPSEYGLRSIVTTFAAMTLRYRVCSQMVSGVGTGCSVVSQVGLKNFRHRTR